MCQALCQPWIGQSLRSKNLHSDRRDWQSRQPQHRVVSIVRWWLQRVMGPQRGTNQLRANCAKYILPDCSVEWILSKILLFIQKMICLIPFQMYLFFFHNALFFLSNIFYSLSLPSFENYIFPLKVSFRLLYYVKFPGVLIFLFCPLTLLMECVFEW